MLRIHPYYLHDLLQMGIHDHVELPRDSWLLCAGLIACQLFTLTTAHPMDVRSRISDEDALSSRKIFATRSILFYKSSGPATHHTRGFVEPQSPKEDHMTII